MPPPIADALIHFQCAHTSLARLAHVGMIAREKPFFAALAPHFQHIAIVSYGDAADHAHSAALAPASHAGRFHCLCNDGAAEPAIFQSSIPTGLAALLARHHCRSALLYTDQHYGGEVAVQTAAALRAAGLRVGLVARCGYHWSWTVARDSSPHDPRAVAAAQLEGDLCRAADIVAVTTRRIADDLAWRHHLDSASIRTIPNFIADPPLVPLFSTRTPGRILFAGRLEPEKRLDLLIRAVALVALNFPAARLTVVGDGSQLASLRALAESMRAPVDFTPRLPHAQLLAEMGRCAAYAQVSRFEGHPKTIIEALAMGAPTVVTRAPGVDDEIRPEITGLVCSDDPVDIAAGLLALLRDPARAEDLSSAAAADIRKRLSFDSIYPSIESACRAAMDSAGAHTLTPPPVRWDQTLLQSPPDAAAATFASSIAAYAKRLAPAHREVFLDSLAARTGSWPETLTPQHRPALPTSV